MQTYEAADGTIFTDNDINRWCEYYDRGEFPPGEHSTGEIVHGKPPRTGAEQTSLTIKVPVGLKKAINAKAKSAGISTSAFVRNQLVQACI